MQTSKTLGNVLLALAGLCTFGAMATEAQARSHQSTVTGPGGQSATREVLRSKGDVSSSTTGPNGKTSSRTVDRSGTGARRTHSGNRSRYAEDLRLARRCARHPLRLLPLRVWATVG